jgi:hypothetical protein
MNDTINKHGVKSASFKIADMNPIYLSEKKSVDLHKTNLSRY